MSRIIRNSSRSIGRASSRAPNLNASPTATDYYAYWPLDGDILDASGNSRHMTSFGGAVTFVAGRIGGQAVSFTTGKYLEIPNFNLSTGTISLWFYSNDGSATYRLVRSSSSTICFGQHLSQWQACALTGGSSISGAWTHMAIVHGVGVYINGVLNISGAVNAAANEVTSVGGPPFSEWFPGTIDDIKWYNRALSLAEITALANN